MVVDDSAVVRGLISRMLEADPEVDVVTTVSNGQAAIAALDRHDVEVVVLDIEMPVMDGMTALPKLLERDPDLKIIMASTLTLKNADVSIKALSAGAADYIPKPSSSREIVGGIDFKQDLLEKVKTLGEVRRKGRAGAALVRTRPDVSLPGPKPVRAGVSGSVVLRKPGRAKPAVIAIGSSTGGPQALFRVLTDLKAANPAQPILITQHMPATFTAILAEHIGRSSGFTAAEAIDGEPLQGGRVYLAPGDYHMTVEDKGGRHVLAVAQTPPENFCRPAVDPMLRSLVKIFGERVAVCILTGMGSDGCKGAAQVVEAGGTVIAQDEASSVVWGMPGAVAMQGLCSAVLPIGEIGAHLGKLAAGRI